MTRKEVLKLVEQEDVEFIRLQFTDIQGNLKNMAVTAGQLAYVLDHKCAFDGNALYGDTGAVCEDLYLEPDLDTFVILPWRPQQGKVARFLCNVYREDGQRCQDSPRHILARVLEKAAARGYSFVVDPECEFFLYHTDENGIPTTVTHDQGGYMDVGPLDLGENARRDMVLTLEEMGFQIESSHHEQAPAQHEIDFKEQEPLHCADSIVTFRSAVRSIGKRFGLHATFMPKPKEGMPGSGMHLNLTVYKDGGNLLASHGEKGVGKEAECFVAGILAHAKALCAVTNPLVNSYKRLSSGFDAPRDVVWSVKKGNSLVWVRRSLGEEGRVELRFPDAAANPYLAMAACIAAGLDGVERGLAGAAFAPECYEKGQKVETLPGTLSEAIACFQEDALMSQVFGKDFVQIYCKAKQEEWDSYMQQVTAWEIERYLYRV